VKVDVEDGLPRIAVRVEERPESALVKAGGPRKSGGAARHLADEAVVLRREIVERGYVRLGDDQQVKRGLRIDVFERQQPVVLEDDSRSNVAADDPAEQALAHDDLRTTAVLGMS
jgi:hypothetical protein